MNKYKNKTFKKLKKTMELLKNENINEDHEDYDDQQFKIND